MPHHRPPKPTSIFPSASPNIRRRLHHRGVDHTSARLSNYPTTKGLPVLRNAIAAWLIQRFGLPAGSIDAERHVLPVNGTREALFAFAPMHDRPTQPAADGNAQSVLPDL